MGNWEWVARFQETKYKKLLYTPLKFRKNLQKLVEGKNVGYMNPRLLTVGHRETYVYKRNPLCLDGQTP
jgi:hypothetical protein